MFGDDYNPNRPLDDEMSKDSGPSLLRDLRSRLTAFWTVLFDPSTGLFRPNVIASSKLESVVPKLGSDPYTQVDVSTKGLVVAGREDPTTTLSAKAHLWTYFFEEGWDDTGSKLTPTTQGADSTHGFAVYAFTVPAGVTRMLVRVQGGGGGGAKTGFTAGGGGGGYAEGLAKVSAGQQFQIVVGRGGNGQGASASEAGYYSRFGLGDTTTPSVITPSSSEWLKGLGGGASGGGGSGSFAPTVDHLIVGFSSGGADSIGDVGGRSGSGSGPVAQNDRLGTRAKASPRGAGGNVAVVGGDGAGGFVTILYYTNT